MTTGHEQPFRPRYFRLDVNENTNPSYQPAGLVEVSDLAADRDSWKRTAEVKADYQTDLERVVSAAQHVIGAHDGEGGFADMPDGPSWWEHFEQRVAEFEEKYRDD